MKRAEDVAIEAIEASRFWSSAVNVNKASDIIRADREAVLEECRAKIIEFRLKPKLELDGRNPELAALDTLKTEIRSAK